MPKQPEQIVSKDWEKAIWEVNRILATLRRDIEGKMDRNVPLGEVTTVTTVQTVAGDDTLHWVL